MASDLIVTRQGTQNGRTEQERLREGEQILRLRNASVPVSEMMERFGLSQVTLYRRIQQALDERLSQSTEQYREAQDESWIT